MPYDFFFFPSFSSHSPKISPTAHNQLHHTQPTLPSVNRLQQSHTPHITHKNCTNINCKLQKKTPITHSTTSLKSPNCNWTHHQQLQTTTHKPQRLLTATTSLTSHYHKAKIMLSSESKPQDPHLWHKPTTSSHSQITLKPPSEFPTHSYPILKPSNVPLQLLHLPSPTLHQRVDLGNEREMGLHFGFPGFLKILTQFWWLGFLMLKKHERERSKREF